MKKKWLKESFQKVEVENLKRQLSREQFHVTQEEGTEPAFSGQYWNENRQGLYVDIVSGEPLFSSLDKFDAGCGWPSFTRPFENSKLSEKSDFKIGYKRVEVRSALADSHLGHVFDDGPEPTGLRYCINSAALRFIALEDLENEGYGEFKKLF